MGRLLILLLYFFTYHYAFSQSLDLELKNIPVEIKNRRFYISEVIDSRTDTGRIGWSVLNRETRGMPFLFTKGSVNELKQYFLKNLPPDTASVPLILNIVSLYIAESGTIMKEGKAYASIEFLREKNGRYGKLFSTTAYTESVSEIARDIYTTHERRIRIVLNKCLENLAESGWEKKVPDYVTLAEIQQESALADTISRKMADTTGLFQTAATRKVIEIQAKSIEVKGRFIP